MTDDTPTVAEPTPPDDTEALHIGEPPPPDPSEGVIPGADTDGYVNDDEPENDPAIEGDAAP